MSELEDYVEFKIKKYSKYNINILYISYIKETLTTDPKLFDEFIEKYKQMLQQSGPKNTFLIVNTRDVKNVDFSYVWSKMDIITKLDKLAVQYLIGTVYIISNQFFKTAGNSIMKVYKPVVPTKICNNNQEGMVFMNDLLSKLDKKN